MRMTEQRKIILQALQSRHDHPSADQVYENVRKSLPRISLGTVYRNLDLLVQSGLINVIESLSTHKRYDPITDYHPHFCCLSCNSIEDLQSDVISYQFNDTSKWAQSVSVESVFIEVRGICATCAAKRKEG